MQKLPLTYKNALIFSLGIAFLMNFLFILMFFFGREAIMPREGVDRPPFKIEPVLIHIVANFLVAFCLYAVNFKLLDTNKSYKKKLLVSVMITFVIVSVLSYIFAKIQIELGDWQYPERFMRGSMSRDFIIALIVIFSTHILYLRYKEQQTLLENETLLAENIQTRYEVLKSQVDPHFLFNSLNTLNALIKIDADKAQEYVQKLSEVFRYTLQNKEIISLKDELEFTQSYCLLMQIRYGENLQFIYTIDEKYYNFAIIPLSLQILVENAIKHNVVTKKQPLIITISTTDDNAIVVSNPVQLKKMQEVGERIGLSNLTERYKLMQKQEIEIRNTSENFEVKVPLMNRNVGAYCIRPM